MSHAIDRIFDEAHDGSGPLDAVERSAAITICDRALLACPQRDLACADAAGLLEMCGLLRPIPPRRRRPRKAGGAP